MPGRLCKISPNQRIDLLRLDCFSHIFCRAGWYRSMTIYSTVILYRREQARHPSFPSCSGLSRASANVGGEWTLLHLRERL